MKRWKAARQFELLNENTLADGNLFQITEIFLNWKSMGSNFLATPAFSIIYEYSFPKIAILRQVMMPK